jgi:thymidine phosphorylase
VPDMKTANWLKKKYEYVGKRLWMKVHVEITKANQPIWAWVWPALQVREVLRVLQQHELRPIDLQNKAVYLCSKVIELIWMAKWKKAYELAYQQLKSGKAWKKMQQIIKAQWWKNPNIKSEELKLWKFKKEVKAEKDWKITAINLHLINSTTRTLGSPIDEQAWLYLHKKIWDKVKKTDIIYVMYANEEDKIKMALDNLKWKKMYEIK